MAGKIPLTVLYRRKRQQRTDYAKRLNLLKSGKKRVVVRFTNHKIIAQLVSFTEQGDIITVGIDSSQLKKSGWDHSLKNTPAAYLTGLLLAKKAQEKKCTEAIMDTGFKTPIQKGKTYAFLKGCLDGGMQIPHGESTIFPDPARLKGEHIAGHVAKSSKIAQDFEKVKSKIVGNK